MPINPFDIPLAQTELRAKAAAAARDAAAALGKPLLEIETDVRDALDIHWEHYHGCALAAIGHLLRYQVGTVLIPASYTFGDQVPWGSHPALDHLWSSERVRFVHDGASMTRFARTEEISRSDVALQHLRVCWQNPDGAYNCGRCPKCLRTMIALRVCGALERCVTLPDELDLAAVRKLHPTATGDVAFTRENLDAAEAAGEGKMVWSSNNHATLVEQQVADFAWELI